MASDAPSIDVEAGFGGSGHGLRITFKDLTYTVESAHEKGKTLELLSNVSGYLEPHKMTALMGPSGSGKTTLLDVLAGRKTTGTTTGTLQFGGVTPSPAFLRRYTGYVEQFDTLIGSLTVTEMLMYTAELKRSISESRSSKAEAVSRLIDNLGLKSCANTRIGDELIKGISGGQAKRTNIGIALVSEPRVLFLDEPTSGLDSYSANEVVELVRSLSLGGVTVVATIHSPSATAFAMFDRILLLAQGKMAYFGPNGDAPLAFARQHWPGADAHHVDCSAAEFLVDLVTDADRKGQAQLLGDAYSSSDLCKENNQQLDAFMAHSAERALTSKKSWKSSSSKTAVPVVSVSTQGDASDASSQDGHVLRALPSSGLGMSKSDLDAQLATKSSTSTPWWWALLVLLKYRARVNYCNPQWVVPRIADKFLFSFIILTLYLRLGDDFGQANLVNLGASLFMWCSLPAYGAVAYVPSIVLDRRLFYRERADGLYLVITYLAAKLIEEIGLAAIVSIIFSSYIFYGVSYQGSFLLFWLVYLMVLAIGIVLGYLIAAISPNMEAANAALPAYVTALLFFAGQLATLDSIPVYWRWFSRIDFLRYSWASLMLNQFEETNPPFAAGETSILDYYGIAGEGKWKNFSYLFAFFAVYATLAYLGLSFIKHSKR